MFKKIGKFVKNHRTEFLVGGAVLVVVAYVRSSREWEVLELHVLKGTKAKMADGSLGKYIQEKGDYEFLIQNKNQGTLFAPGDKNDEMRTNDIPGDEIFYDSVTKEQKKIIDYMLGEV